jgi:formylglycine-generating enzyme required for sulfatase activity
MRGIDMQHNISNAGRRIIRPLRAVIIALIVLIMSFPAMSNQEAPPAKEPPPTKNTKPNNAMKKRAGTLPSPKTGQGTIKARHTQNEGSIKKESKTNREAKKEPRKKQGSYLGRVPYKRREPDSLKKGGSIFEFLKKPKTPIESEKEPLHTKPPMSQKGPPLDPKEPPPGWDEIRKSFVQIPAGEFLMGSESDSVDEKPAHRVRISQNFEMGKYEVTQAQWQAVMGNNPSFFKGANLPVEQVSWDEAQEFIKKLNSVNDGYLYRLPTEAEWEYACRAGKIGDYAVDMKAMAWFDPYRKSGFFSAYKKIFEGGASEKKKEPAPPGGAAEKKPPPRQSLRTHPVGSKQPNAWGLFDMYGNVWEWCQDWYDSAYYAQNSNVDPQGPAMGSERVRRGGCYNTGLTALRLTNRASDSPDTRLDYLGFRLVRTRR